MARAILTQTDVVSLSSSSEGYQSRSLAPLLPGSLAHQVPAQCGWQAGWPLGRKQGVVLVVRLATDYPSLAVGYYVSPEDN